jgi:hypothetical protein
MNGCKYIKERIDEAEKPDLLSFEVTEHIGQCDDCERFAIERTALRKLVAGGTRVSAPINFDAMLNARLAEVKARRSFWRLGPTAYLRLGAATAGLVVMIFAAQYAGLFSANPRVSNESQSQSRGAVPIPTPTPGNPAPSGPDLVAPSPGPVVASSGRQYPVSSSAPRVRRGDFLVGRAAPAGYLTAEDGGVVLVRGRNGDMDVQMPTVSVGAQPLLYVSAGQRTVRNVGTSF